MAVQALKSLAAAGVLRCSRLELCPMRRSRWSEAAVPVFPSGAISWLLWPKGSASQVQVHQGRVSGACLQRQQAWAWLKVLHDGAWSGVQ